MILCDEISQLAHGEKAFGESVGSAHFCLDGVAAFITFEHLCP
jgi:hypothetical protein